MPGLRRFSVFLAAILACSGAGSAGAEVHLFDATIRHMVPGLAPGMNELVVASGVGVAEIDGPRLDLTSFEFLGPTIAGTFGIPVTDPAVAPLTSIRVADMIGTGRIGIGSTPSFSAAITSSNVEMPGHLQFCMLVAPLPPCISGFVVPFVNQASTAGVGLGGSFHGGDGSVQWSVQGAPWTVNTTFVTGQTSNGASVVLSTTGMIVGPYLNAHTAKQEGGELWMVTPAVITIEQGGEAQLIAGFKRIEIRILPEPGVLLLLGSGAVGMLLIGRRRTRSTAPADRNANEGRE